MQITTEFLTNLRAEFIRNLRAVKFTEEQAEALVNIIERRMTLQENIIQQNNKETAENKAEIFSIKSKDLATKGDLKEVELKIKEVEANLELQIKTLEVKLEQYRYDAFKFIVWTGVLVLWRLLEVSWLKVSTGGSIVIIKGSI